MKNTGMIKTIDELGRIVLPKEIRTHLGLEYKTPIEVFVEDESIILRKIQKKCVFCGRAENLTEYREKAICENCLNDLTE